MANDTRIHNQQTEAFEDDHAEWATEIANIHAARLVIELDLGVNAILPNVPNAAQYAAAMAVIGADPIEPILNLAQPQAGARQLANIKKYENELAQQKVDADKAMAIITAHLGPSMLVRIIGLTEQHLPVGFTQRDKVIQLWEYIIGFTRENTQILNDIRADFNRIPVVNTWAEAYNAVCTCNYLNHELRIMGIQHVKPDAELITLITNKMQADCFQAITLQVQQRNPHRQTIAAAPLLGAAAQPAQNPFMQALVQGLAQVGVVIDPMAVQLGPAQPIMDWATFSQMVLDNMVLDQNQRVKSVLVTTRQPIVNAASLATSSAASSSSSSSSSSTYVREAGPEPKRQHRETNGTHYAHSAEVQIAELTAQLADYQQRDQFRGSDRYPQQQQQPPRYQQFPQQQQYRQQEGQQHPPRNGQFRGNGYAPRGRGGYRGQLRSFRDNLSQQHQHGRRHRRHLFSKRRLDKFTCSLCTYNTCMLAISTFDSIVLLIPPTYCRRPNAQLATIYCSLVQRRR